MINANELRIGNWISYKGKPIDIESVSKWGVDAWSDEGIVVWDALDEHDPIPLTTDILESVPFETLSVGSQDTTYWQQHKPDIDFVLTWYVKDESIEWEGRKIKYVHQLQNLYFALIGEELTINL